MLKVFKQKPQWIGEGIAEKFKKALLYIFEHLMKSIK